MSAEAKEMTPPTLQRAGVVAEGNQQSDSTAIHIGVEDVIVADRYRKDLGDVSDLKVSIIEVGLLNPITVREWHGGYRLVAGERRLTAFKELGLAEIPARVARDIADARDALVAERDENTARKEMLPSEKVALGMAIEQMEKPAAAERQREAGLHYGRGKDSSGSRDPNLSGKQDMRPRDIAAEAIDMGEATYRRIKTVVKLTTDGEQPEEVREAAKVALEVIDAGGSARGEYDRVKAVRRNGGCNTSGNTVRSDTGSAQSDMQAWHESLAERYPLPRLAFEAEGHERHETLDAFQGAARSRYKVKYKFTEKSYARHCAQSAEWLDRSSMNLEVALDVLSHIDFSTINPEQAHEALQRIEALPRQLNLYIRSLKGITNEH